MQEGALTDDTTPVADREVAVAFGKNWRQGPRARTQANPGGLTGRELEVVELLANGLRNAQIAERLVVSRKTVDHHVSAILRKLRVGTRTEAVA